MIRQVSTSGRNSASPFRTAYRRAVRLTSSLAAVNAALLAFGALAVASVAPVRPAGPVPVERSDPQPAALEEVGEPAASATPEVGVTSPPITTPTAIPPVVLPPTPAAPPAAAPPQAASVPARTPAAQRLAPAARVVSRTGWGPYATVGPVTLHFPGQVVELVGQHQSSHDGAQPQRPVDGPARVRLLDSRARDTDRRGAADIVVDPTREVRAPVTGTVVRAGTYTLYCDYVDNVLFVEPDARPGWQVKMLHFQGLQVRVGDRVKAGVTVVGSGARLLPFASQVDKLTAAPHWPHLHVEVVDPSVPDRPSSGSCP